MDLAYVQPDSSVSRPTILFLYTYATYLTAKELVDLDFEGMVRNKVTLCIARYVDLRGINTLSHPSLLTLVQMYVSNIHGACIHCTCRTRKKSQNPLKTSDVNGKRITVGDIADSVVGRDYTLRNQHNSYPSPCTLATSE